MKRFNDNSQLRADEVEALNHEEQGELGTFKRASAEELSKRRIVRTKRSSTSAVPSEAPKSTAGSAFAGFASAVAAASKPDTSATTASASNPFSSFQGFAPISGLKSSADNSKDSGGESSRHLPFPSAFDNAFSNNVIAKPTAGANTAAASAASPSVSSFPSSFTFQPAKIQGTSGTGVGTGVDGPSTTSSSAFTGFSFAAAPKPALTSAPAPSSAPVHTPGPAQFSFSTGISNVKDANATSLTTNDSGEGVGKDSSLFAKKLRKLNASFLQWVEKQTQNHPLSIWKSGIQDYIRHYDRLAEACGGLGSSDSANAMATASGPTFPARTKTVAAVEAAAAPSSAKDREQVQSSKIEAESRNQEKAKEDKEQQQQSFNFSFVAPQTSSSASSFSAGFPAFGSSSAAADSTTKTPSATGAPPFSFGGSFDSSKPFGAGANLFAPPAPSSSSSMFGSAPFGSFSGGTTGFGAGAVGGFGTGAGGGAENDEEGGEPLLEPEKILRNADDTDKILLEVPCKLFRFDVASKEWKDTGKGTFRITEDANSGKRRMLVRNSSGRITFNAGFFSAMKVENPNKTSLRFSAVVTPLDNTVSVSTTGKEGEKKVEEPKPELRNFMLKVKDTATALRLMEESVQKTNS